MIEGKRYAVKEKTLMVFRPVQIHRVHVSGNQPYEYFSLMCEESILSSQSVQKFSKDVGIFTFKNADIIYKWMQEINRQSDNSCWGASNKNRLLMVEQYSIIYDVSPEKSMWGYGLGPQTRVEYIISQLLLKCSDEEYESFLSLITEDYGKLGVILSVWNWLKSDKYDSSEIRKQRAEKLQSHHTAMCERIVKEKIDLYADNYYHAENAWGMYHCYKANDAVDTFTSYIKSILSPHNVYRVLWDVKTCAIGDNYRYSINDDNLSVYLGGIEAVKKLVNENPPKSKDEEFVYQMYDIYCNGEPDVWGHKGVVSATEMVLCL